MIINKEQTLGEIVASDIRAAAVFEKAGFDFCCDGRLTIEKACEQTGLPLNEITAALKQLDGDREPGVTYDSWSLDVLADYIEKKHHKYVSEQIPILRAFLHKITAVHGNNHPELYEINKLFNACAEELTGHMLKEERILFPFIRKLEQARRIEKPKPEIPFGTVENPISMMMHDHEVEGDRFRKIREQSGQYIVPSDGCNTYKAAFAGLKNFENDLHIHIHLENNILFPKAVELEKLLQAG
jgi:regulator of cell morphogenesis and NO signaling